VVWAASVLASHAADWVDLAGLAAGVHDLGPPAGRADDAGRHQWAWSAGN